MPFHMTTVHVINKDTNTELISLEANNHTFSFFYFEDDFLTINSETYVVRYRRWNITPNSHDLYVYVTFYSANWREGLT